MKNIIYKLCLLLFLFIPASVNATNEFENKKEYYDYVIENYDISIKVNENNSLEITEKIDVYFNMEKHGIFRKIPLTNEVVRVDGTRNKNRARIKNIKVDEEYSLSSESGYRVIKIGDPDYTLSGKKSYTISYLYELGKDPLKDSDELYFNLIGSEWDTMIGNVTFKIEMPSSFDESKLGFSSGEYGTIGTNDISYEVNDKLITGKLNNSLMLGEALTVRLELPEGYFIYERSNWDILMILALILPIIFAIISFLIWKKYGKDDEVIETVEFYPPENMNSLEIAFYYNGKASSKDVTSLLIYLANKGYVKIIETNDNNLFTMNSFKIVKLKDYDGTNTNEALFLDGLFENAQTINGVLEVSEKDLYNSFYKTLNKIMNNMNRKSNKNKIFEKSASSKKKLLITLILLTFGLITIPPVYYYGDMEMLILVLLFPGIGFSFLFIGLADLIEGILKKQPKFEGVFKMIWGIMFGGGPWLMMMLPTLLQDINYLIIYIVGIMSVMGIVISYYYLPKRTLYGNTILGKIKGFKNFLETAEKDKLEQLVIENPTYFYDILPYTYVLGISSKWIKKFETIALYEPDWYDSPNGFDVVRFGTFVNHTMTRATSAMASSPNSGGSGSSGGGGFSGGGSGGGGGGSW